MLMTMMMWFGSVDMEVHAVDAFTWAMMMVWFMWIGLVDMDTHAMDVDVIVDVLTWMMMMLVWFMWAWVMLWMWVSYMDDDDDVVYVGMDFVDVDAHAMAVDVLRWIMMVFDVDDDGNGARDDVVYVSMGLSRHGCSCCGCGWMCLTWMIMMWLMVLKFRCYTLCTYIRFHRSCKMQELGNCISAC
jgi:hypothetical protein